MRRLFVVLPVFLACCGGGDDHPTHPDVTFPHIEGVLAGVTAGGATELGVFDVDLDVQLVQTGTTGTDGHATGTLSVDPTARLPITGTYSGTGVLNLAGSGYVLTEMSEVGNFDGPYTGPTTSGSFTAIQAVSDRFCGTVAGDETGVMAFVVAYGQARVVMATEGRRSSSAGDIHAGPPRTMTADGPEKLHLDGTEGPEGVFTGTWAARDHSGTWTASRAGCP